MNILLTAINAKYIHSNLAVYSLRAASGNYRDHVQIAEFTINNQKDYILNEIYRRKPDVLCFSVYIWNVEMVESTAREFHKLCPQVPIWVGGPEVSFETAAFLEDHPYITGVVIGEGEITFRELCGSYLDQKTEQKDIPGLAFRRPNGSICFTGERAPLEMSSLPFAYDLTGDFNNRIIYYESSRGCPFRCSYCLSSVEKSLRFRDNSLVLKELQFFIDHKVPQIKFVDRTFNCNHEHAMEIWRYLIDHDNGITNFHFEIEADLLNKEELDLMAQMRPGLIQLEIGVQSTNEVTIKEIHRTMKLERLKAVVRRIQAGGNIHQHLDLIAGLPYEGYDSFARSFDEIYALKPNQLQLGFLKVLKGSFMYEHAGEYGLVYHDQPPYEVMYTSWISYEEIQKIKRVEEMLEVYYNSGQFEVTMKVLEPVFGSAFAFFQQFGDLYDRKGYFGMSHSRIRRCEILLEFLKENYTEIPNRENGQTIVDTGNTESAGTGESIERTKTRESIESSELSGSLIDLVQEALTFDLYYRENCKSRPSWAPDMSSPEWKEKTHRYCRNGKMSHVERFHYRFPGKQQYQLTEVPRRTDEPVWVLFSYDRRDPLDNQAAVEILPETERQ